ncbi:MAG: hypothetical protein AMS27_10605 [Bacteroides sp. SM23_62_1]|nr:MAG: hypothetical protein AMS27_10605 [Bacteroides sp. SM23_62_1]
MRFCIISYHSWLFILIGLVSISIPVYSAYDNYPAGAHYAGMGNVGVMCSDVWSLSQNQAGLGFFNHLAAGFYHENRFALSELAHHSIAFSLPTGTGTFGLTCTYFGYSLYNESKIGLGFGKALNKKFSAGLQFNWLNTHIEDETGNLGAMAIEAGILAKPIENLSVGFHVFNPTVSHYRYQSGTEPIPVIIRFGMGYEYREKLFIAFETLKNMYKSPALFKGGVEYRLIQNLYARTGIMVGNFVSHTAGLGIILKKIMIDFAFSHHQLLGYTPHFSIQYSIK